MGNFLQKVLASADKGKAVVRAAKSANIAGGIKRKKSPQDLPSAAIVYGGGAGVLFVAAFSLLMNGRWFSGIMVFILGGCLTAFALHCLKHQD
jgi:hypothetical protein